MTPDGTGEAGPLEDTRASSPSAVYRTQRWPSKNLTFTGHENRPRAAMIRGGARRDF